MIWSPQQDAALKKVDRWLTMPGEQMLFRLFGFAGTGKTTLAIEIAKMVRGRCLFASFTGKAALVMRRKGCAGASTIHSLIYTVREDDDDGGDSTGNGDDMPMFTLNPDSELCRAALLIVDECSMVDEELGKDLMSFKVPILVLGDPAQLPPVAGGGYFTSAEPDVMLTEIHRQAEGNPIIHIATDIRLGKRVQFGNFKGDRAGTGVSVIKRSALMRSSMLAADQIICGKNDTRCSLNRKMRAHLREAGRLPAGSDALPVIGERIICLRNKKDRALFNGGIFEVKQQLEGWPSKKDGLIKKPGRSDVSYLEIESLDDPEDAIPLPIRVPHAFWFWNGKAADLQLPDDIKRRTYDEFDMAYAITCHKSQGSQWDKVVVIDERFIFGRDGDEEMPRRWAYTAVTRAAEALILAI